MDIIPDTIYHIYNRGNNREPLFYQERNFDFFLQKAVKQLSHHVDFLAYCLMTNHFHFLVNSKETIRPKEFSNSYRILLTSYTRAIQNQEKRTGSLFQQNSKAVEVVGYDYTKSCFNYIHRNPLKARLVERIEDWPYSSFNEYWKGSPGICNVTLGRKLLNISNDVDQFYFDSLTIGGVVSPLQRWHD